MDVHTSRWAMVVLMSRAELDELHKIERERWDKLGRTEGAYQTAANAMSAGMRYLIDFSERSGPFWKPRTQETHKKAEMARFERFILPLWAKRKRAYMASVGDELGWFHAADEDIHASAFVFRRGGLDGEMERIKAPVDPHAAVDHKAAAAGEFQEEWA